MRKSDRLVVVLVVLNYALEAALLTRVDGFQLPPVAVYLIAVILAPIGPLLAILPQLGIRVPSLIGPSTEMLPPPIAPEPTAPTPLHPAP